jgi:DNA-binding NarL/FixJ family response regulator
VLRGAGLAAGRGHLVTTTVLLVDDQDLVRSGLRLILELGGVDVVGEAGDGAAAATLADELRPDVVLMDVRMPGTDGVEGARRIAAARLPCRVVMLTTFDLDRYVYAALSAGASGFLLKDVTAERLVEGVRLVADGSMLLGPAVTRHLVEDFAARTPPEPDVRLAGLSPREREVLLELARGRSNPEIAARLHIGGETVKSHVGEVLRKLQLRDRVQAVVYCYERGLVTPGSGT